MLIIFVLLIAGPIVAGKFMTSLPSIPMELLQPTGLDHNDTNSASTGASLVGSIIVTGAQGGSAAASSTAGAKLLRF